MADDGEADGAAAPPGGEEALIGGVDPKLLRKALKKRGFTFVGSTICYAFMQATGMVNDHIVGCVARRAK